MYVATDEIQNNDFRADTEYDMPSRLQIIRIDNGAPFGAPLRFEPSVKHISYPLSLRS